MKPQLTGKPLNEDDILAMQCREILFLRNTKEQPVPLTTLLLAAIDYDEAQVVEAAVAMGRLEKAGQIIVLNFGQKYFIQLASTADEAQGSTSRLAAGGKGVDVGQTSAPDFSILHRPHIVKSREEVHIELCHSCERMAAGHCECGNPVCSVHRYNAQGDREPNGGFCVMCSAVPQDRTEIFSNGRQV